MYTFFNKKLKHHKSKGFSKNPFFYFGLTSFVLFGVLFFSSDSLAQPNYLKSSDIVFFNDFFKSDTQVANSDLFFSQNSQATLQTPDLKIIQNNSLGAVSTTSVLTTQTLGDIFGGQDQNGKDMRDYTVEAGDTMKYLAEKFGVTVQTIAWANDISKNATLNVGQSLIIPPVDGVLYEVKSGDTLSDIAKKYKSSVDKIVAFNDLKDEGDIFVHDVIFLEGGQMPLNPVSPIIQVPIANNFFIYPTEGVVSQGPHGILQRAIDVANKCGTPIYAAASGVVQRAQFSVQYGNFITISHYNGTSTYYGHEQTLLVKPGDVVTVGQMIGLMGKTGREATGCHLHFEVRGAKNFLSQFGLGARISFK